MSAGAHRAAVWGIWGLLAAYALVQILAWSFGGRGLTSLQVSVSWIVLIVLAVVATRRIGFLSTTLLRSEKAHRDAQTELEQLQTQNAMLRVVSQSVDVPLAFLELAQRITPLVPCDRVGLALLNDEGNEFQTYTARVSQRERRSRPRPEVVFKAEGTAIGNAVRSGAPLFIHDTREQAADLLDVNILHTTGFASALIIPLVARGRSVGTLNVVSRKPRAFMEEHAATLLPIAEIFAVAHVAHQLQAALARHQTMQTMAELAVGISAEINSALQTIIGHCDLIERGSSDPTVRRDLSVVVSQAQRISSLLDKMRLASQSATRVS